MSKSRVSGATSRTARTDTDMSDILNGLSEFVDSVVVPLEDKNSDLFDNGRNFYAADGAYSEPVRGLLREVRERASEAGYYTMFVPEDVGGAGLGPVLLYEV